MTKSEMVAADVRRRKVVPFGREIRLLTSAATEFFPGDEKIPATRARSGPGISLRFGHHLGGR